MFYLWARIQTIKNPVSILPSNIIYTGFGDKCFRMGPFVFSDCMNAGVDNIPLCVSLNYFYDSKKYFSFDKNINTMILILSNNGITFPMSCLNSRSI